MIGSLVCLYLVVIFRMGWGWVCWFVGFVVILGMLSFWLECVVFGCFRFVVLTFVVCFAVFV